MKQLITIGGLNVADTMVRPAKGVSKITVVLKIAPPKITATLELTAGVFEVSAVSEGSRRGLIDAIAAELRRQLGVALVAPADDSKAR